MQKNNLLSRSGIIVSTFLVAILALAMFVMPTQGNLQTKADSICDNAPVTPTFNFWPITYDDVNTPACHDFRAVDAAKLDGVHPAVFSQNETDWQNGLDLQSGDTGIVLGYIHNGASNTIDRSLTDAENVKITTHTDTTVGSSHAITVTYTGQDTSGRAMAPYTETYTVHTPANAALEVVPNSGNFYTYDSRLISDMQNSDLGNSTFNLGKLNACFDFSLFFSFKFKVVTPQAQTPNLAIKKLVKNDTLATGYADDQVQARTGDRVTFQVTVTNTGNAVANNVVLNDTLPNGLDLQSDSIRLDNVSGGSTVNVALGNLNPGQSRVLTFTSQVLAVGPATICNVATATGSNVNQVSDNACVQIVVIPKPGTPNIVLSKRAFNDTKNIDATKVNASREDFITYSLVTTNTGTADAVNYVISDDLSQVLPLADMVDTMGGTLSGQTISYPAVTIHPGETVVKTFKVRVKASLAANLSYQMKNTYGNTIVINIPGKEVFEAPKTGAAGTSAAVFAGLITSGFVLLRKGRAIVKFISA